MAQVASRLVNVTVDDFDPLIYYNDYSEWLTPNPQDNPTWWNASSEVTGTRWNQATYHWTTTQGSMAVFYFTGSAITIYGAIGPLSNVTINLDPALPQPYTQTLVGNNATDPQVSMNSDQRRRVIFEASGLTYAQHVVEILNQGEDDTSGFLLDSIVVGIELGADGATLTNTTVQDNDPAITFSGDWTEQSGPNFSGGTSHYTEGPGNSWSFAFEGSAIYIYGDQVNDHGNYSIYLNDSSSPYGTYNGRSGCGIADYSKTCEKLHGLIGFIGGLPAGRHTVRLENQGPSGENETFVDLDYLEYNTPSQYSTAELGQLSQCPFTICGGSNPSPSTSPSTSGGASGTAPAASASSSGAAGHNAEGGMGMLGLIMGLWLFKRIMA